MSPLVYFCLWHAFFFCRIVCFTPVHIASIQLIVDHFYSKWVLISRLCVCVRVIHATRLNARFFQSTLPRHGWCDRRAQRHGRLLTGCIINVPHTCEARKKSIFVVSCTKCGHPSTSPLPEALHAAPEIRSINITILH